MASVKVKFRPSTTDTHEGTIFYQILHERKQRQIFSDYHIFPAEWDGKRSTVILNPKSERLPHILSIRERMRWDVDRLNKIIRKLNNEGFIYTAEDVIDEFNRHANEYSFFNYMIGVIIKLKQNGKIRTAETYVSTLNSFRRFRKGEDIMLDCLNSEIMEAYQAWHHQRGVSPNTISFYTRIIRAAYNRAVEEGIIENRNPFRHVYTGIDKTIKRALPLQFIKKIKGLDLSLMQNLTMHVICL